MSTQRSIGGIDVKDHYYFKVYKVLVSEARRILHYIFGLQFPQGIKKPHIDHFKKLPKVFNNDSLERIKSDPSGDKFDITLLCACITASKKSMITVISPIRKFRNEFFHNPKGIASVGDMKQIIDNLKGLLNRAINKAQQVYIVENEDIDAVLGEMNQKIEEISDCEIPLPLRERYRKEIKELRDANKTLFQDEGVPTLKETFKFKSNVDPISFLTGKHRLNVKTVYTPLDIVDKTDTENSNRHISIEELLELQTADDKKPAVIVIEGDAGSGKSTLAKYILRSWAGINIESESSEIRGLSNYEVVLYFECKNRSISSFLELIQTLVPNVANQMTDDDLIRSVLNLRTLVIVDGLDEMGEESEALREMLEKYYPRSTAGLHFIITTRPHKMQNVGNLCRDIPRIHTRIKGIPQERRVEFVTKLHEALIKERGDNQDTSRLGDYVKQSEARLGEHYRLPLNLSLLTYLWVEDPETMHSVTSATNLYSAFLKLLKSRLISRITRFAKDIKDVVDKFTETVCEVYLRTHVSGDLQISDESYKLMKTVCENLELPFDDMVGEFFEVDNVWTPYDGMQTCFSAPHKSIMEFFCASFISTRLSAKDHEQSQVRDTLTTLLKLNDKVSVDFSHHLNVILHLGGLLALREDNALHKYGAELVNFLQEGGVQNEQWLDLVTEAKFDPNLTTLVAQKISQKLVVRDGHTSAAIEIFKNLNAGIAVKVIFECEIQYIPELDKFMKSLSERDCDVELLFTNHWKNPGNQTNHLESLLTKRCRVKSFIGNLDNIEVLSIDTKLLRFTIANDQQAEALGSSIRTLNGRPNLTDLGVHVTMNVSPASLKPLPDICSALWISGVCDNNIDQACNIARKLLPEKQKFKFITFPRSQLTVEGYKQLLKKLKERGVEVSRGRVLKLDSINLNESDVESLRMYTKETLGCRFHWQSNVW